MGKPGGKRRKRSNHVNKCMGRRWKTKYVRGRKDIDEIDADLAPQNAHELLNQKIDCDKPGEGQHYCIHCALYFINKVTLAVHLKTKAHKKRLKELRLEPHTQDEAERAAGMGNFIMPANRIVRGLNVDDQVRDAEYLMEEDEAQQESIISGLQTETERAEVEKMKKKQKDSLFIPCKSKKDIT